MNLYHFLKDPDKIYESFDIDIGDSRRLIVNKSPTMTQSPYKYEYTDVSIIMRDDFLNMRLPYEARLHFKELTIEKSLECIYHEVSCFITKFLNSFDAGTLQDSWLTENQYTCISCLKPKTKL